MASNLSKDDKIRLGTGQVKPRRQDYMRMSCGSILTPKGLASAISAADAGQIRQLVEIVEDVLERDAHLRGIVQTRVLAVAGNEWEVRPNPADAKGGVKVAESVSAMLESIPGLDGILKKMLYAIVHPLQACEISWDFSAGQVAPTGLAWAHPKRFCWNTAYVGVPGLDLGELRLITDENLVYGERLLADKWFVHQTDAEGWAQRAGLGRGLARLYLHKQEALNNLSIYGEVFGMPWRVGNCDPNATDDEKQAVTEALESLGSDAYAVLSSATQLQIIQAAAGGEKVYDLIVSICNAEMSKMVLGHTGSADSTPGKLGAESSADSIREDLLQADASGLEASVTRCLIEPFVRFNFGAGTPVPEFTFCIEPEADLVDQASRVKTAVEIGLPVSKSWYADQQGITLAETPDDALGVPKAPTPPTGGGFPSLGLRSPTLASGGHDLVRLAVSKESVAQVDSLIQAALREAGSIYGAFVQPVKAAFESASDFADLKTKLEAIGLDPAPVADLIHRTQLSGVTLGIGQVGQETGVIGKSLGVKWAPLPAEKAIAWLEARVPVDREAFSKLSDQMKTKCFSLANHDGENLIAGVKDKITAALKDGQSFEQFAKGYDKMMADLGVSQTSPWHLETVFRTNAANAMQAGRYHQMTRPETLADRPYWQYHTVGDHAVRDDHAALDGLCFPADHEFWSENYPPNGFNCRCSVTCLSESQVSDRGVDVLDTAPDGLPQPDAGFASDPIGSLLEE